MRVSLSGKFSLLFRHFRGREFLEGRIVPQRIEHSIEPEQRGSERRKVPMLSRRAQVAALYGTVATLDIQNNGADRS